MGLAIPLQGEPREGGNGVPCPLGAARRLSEDGMDQTKATAPAEVLADWRAAGREVSGAEMAGDDATSPTSIARDTGSRMSDIVIDYVVLVRRGMTPDAAIAELRRVWSTRFRLAWRRFRAVLSAAPPPGSRRGRYRHRRHGRAWGPRPSRVHSSGGQPSGSATPEPGGASDVVETYRLRDGI